MKGRERVALGEEGVEVVAAGERRPWPATCPREKQTAAVALVAVAVTLAATAAPQGTGITLPLAWLEEVEGLE